MMSILLGATCSHRARGMPATTSGRARSRVNSLSGIHSPRASSMPANCRTDTQRRILDAAYALFRQARLQPREHGRDRRRDEGHQAHALLSLREQGSAAVRGPRSAASLGLGCVPDVRRPAVGIARDDQSTGCSASLPSGRIDRAGPDRASRASSSSSPTFPATLPASSPAGTRRCSSITWPNCWRMPDFSDRANWPARSGCCPRARSR